MSLEQKRILRYTLLDLVFFFCGFVISLYIAKNYPIDIDISFYGLVLAFSIATFTIPTFVCTMNYTGQNKLLILLIEKQGDLFKNRWMLIFIFEIAAALLQIFSFIINSYSQQIAISIALGGLALCTAQVIRSIRLLIAIMRIAEMSQKKEARDIKQAETIQQLDKYAYEEAKRRNRERRRKDKNID